MHTGALFISEINLFGLEGTGGKSDFSLYRKSLCANGQIQARNSHVLQLSVFDEGFRVIITVCDLLRLPPEH